MVIKCQEKYPEKYPATPPDTKELKISIMAEYLKRL